MRNIPGIIYLIHFDEPLCFTRSHPSGKIVNVNVCHYLGWTGGRLNAGLNSYDLLQRMDVHLSGQGAKILAALNERGIKWSPVAAWDKHNPPNWLNKNKDSHTFLATRNDERKMKQQKNTPRFCPICS